MKKYMLDMKVTENCSLHKNYCLLKLTSEQLRGLSEARLRLQNIKMTTANLQIIAPPEFPLTDNGRKRLLYVVAALIASLIFITFYFLII